MRLNRISARWHFLLIAILLISSFSIPTAVSAATVTKLSSAVKGTVTGIVAGSNLNVRNGPSTSNTIIAKLQNGNTMNVTGYTSDGWLEMNTSSIKLGYVNAPYVNVPVVSVSMTATTKSVTVGSATATGYSIFPACATTKTVTWTSSNTAVGTVDTAGKLTAKAPGTTTVTVKTTNGSKTATCVYTVTQPVTGVTLNKTTSALNVGATQQLTATVAPSNATNKAVTWASSNTAVATVSSAGLVTAKAAGTATITVKTANGSKTATCVYTISAIAVTGVTLNKTTSALTVGATEQLTATVAPANATNKAVTWASSNTAVATVSSAGLVTAKAAGTATITVKTTSGAKTATCTYTVSTATIAVTGVNLNKTTSALTAGNTEQLTATVTPSNATNKAVTWTSSNTTVATVSSTGLVTAVAAGSATVTVKTTSGAKTATCTYTVSAAASTLAITGAGPATQTITPGKALNVTGKVTSNYKITSVIAAVKTATGTVKYTYTDKPNATSYSVSTAMNNAILFSSLAAGTYTFTLTATDGYTTKTFTSTITVQAPTSTLAITSAAPTSQTIVTNKALNVAGKVTSNYKITSVTAAVKATSGTVKYSYTDKPNATSYSVSTAMNNAIVFNKLGVGTYIFTLTATDGYTTKTFTSTISIEIPVTGVTLNKTKSTLVATTAEQLTATVAPSNATNKAVTWTSSNTKVATVSTTGKVTAVAAGTATITVKTNDVLKAATATCVYTVTPLVKVTGVTLNKKTSTLVATKTEQLTATVAPTNATNKVVTWSSSNTAIATVSPTGLVTAKAAGSVTITVTTADGAKTAVCTYTITPAVAATGVTLNKKTSALTAPATEQLTATVAPSNTTNKTLTWTSSNTKVATVSVVSSTTGKVTAVGAGTATITVKTSNGKTATCVYTIKAASTLALTNSMTIPNPLTPGRAVVVKGLVTSKTYPITTVTLQIKSTATGQVFYGASSGTINTMSYDTNKLDAKMLFSKLSSGSFTYVVTAKDSSGTIKTLRSTVFSMASTLVITGTKTAPPASLPQGQGVSVKGTVTSNYKVMSVQAGITNSSGTWLSGYPKSSSVNLSSVDASIKFNVLGVGSYYFKVVARDSSMASSKTLQNTAFKVVAQTGSLSNTISDKGLLLLMAMENGYTSSQYGKPIRNQAVGDGGITVGFGHYVKYGNTAEINRLKTKYGVDASTVNSSISFDNALKLLREDMGHYQGLVNTFSSTYNVKFTQQQFDALVIQAYNCWSTTFTKVLRNGANVPRSTLEGAILSYYKGLSTWSRFGKGWTNRLRDTMNVYYNGNYTKDY